MDLATVFAIVGAGTCATFLALTFGSIWDLIDGSAPDYNVF